MNKPNHWIGISKEEWNECVVLEYCISQGYATTKEIDRRIFLQSKMIYKKNE